MKFIYLTIGFFAFVLGCAGIVLPVLRRHRFCFWRQCVLPGEADG